jgi:hypothetical protein
LRVSVAYTIGDFLHDLEAVRGNSPATRNARLAAIHSLFSYASLRAPEHANLISRVLGIQTKRATTTTVVTFLNPAELDALLAAPDQSHLARPPRPRPARPGRAEQGLLEGTEVQGVLELRCERDEQRPGLEVDREPDGGQGEHQRPPSGARGGRFGACRRRSHVRWAHRRLQAVPGLVNR